MKTIWQIKDGKRGHENQSRGLIRAIAKLHPVETIEIDVNERRASWLDCMTGGGSHFSGLAKPDLIVGTGSQTHATLLAAGRVTKAPTVALMAPPRGIAALFDLCIVPEHDGRSGTNIITTKGVINLVEINTEKDAQKGLFLVGGASKHHGWDGQQVVEQLTQIVEHAPAIRWTATTSRRSPETTSSELTAIEAENLTILPVEETDGGWLPAQLATASYVWVTEDSVSMIYEALSSGAKVGVLPVPRKAESSRVIRGVDLLIEQGQVLPYSADSCDLSSFDAPEPLNEATRVAQIVTNRFWHPTIPSPSKASPTP